MVQRVVDSKYVLVNANAPGASLFFLSLFFFYFPSDFMNSHVNPNIYIYIYKNWTLQNWLYYSLLYYLFY